MRTKRGLDETLVLLGALAGFLLGGIIAWLRSPLSGQQQRQRLLRWGDELRGSLDASDDVARSIDEGKMMARQQAAGAADREAD